MSLRPKTARRLILLAIAAFLLAGSAFGFVFVRQWQNERLDARHRAEGLAAAAEGRHVDAMTSLSRYLRRNQGDAEAILAYARARLRIEDRDGNYLQDAIDKYQRLLDLTPDDRAARLELLDLYLRVGYWKEAAETAQRLRPGELAEATDIPTLIKEATALLSAREFGPRLPAILARVHEIDPLNPHAHLAYLALLAATDRESEAIPHAEVLLGRAPEDPRAGLVMAYAILTQAPGDGADRASALLARCAGLDPDTAERAAEPAFDDPDLVGRIVLGFDAAGRPDLALKLLELDAPRLGDPLITRITIRRLWQSGRLDDVVAQAERLAPGDDADTEVLALRANALMTLGRTGEASALIERIESRVHDYRAGPWASVLRLGAQGTSPADRVASLTSAVKANPHEPIFTSMLGEQLASLGRREEAWEQWRAAIRAPLSASWAAPRVALGESLLAAGRLTEAYQAIADARRIAPRTMIVNVAWVECATALLAQGLTSPLTAGELLEIADAFDEELASRGPDEAIDALRERLLPCRVDLAILDHRHAEAGARVRAALDPAIELQPATLQRLSNASEAGGLGLEGEVAARLQQSYGELPTVVFARAIEMLGSEGPEPGLALLREAAARGASQGNPAIGRGDVEWQVAIARFLELARHADAPEAWVALGEAHPGDLGIQRMILESSSIAADREFVERTVGRYKALIGKETGLEPIVVRLARARTMLRSGSARDRADAIAILNVIVGEESGNIEARLLLARSLATADPARGGQADIPGAIRQYEEVLSRVPGRAVVALELARLYQGQRDFARSRETIEGVLNDPTVDEGIRLAAARALVAQGDGAIAVLAIEPIVEARADGVDNAVLLALAQGYLSLRRDEDAARVFDRLAARRIVDPVVAYATAESIASRGRFDEGLAIIRGLDESLVGTGTREALEARLTQHFRAADEAIAAYELAIAAAPRRIESWRGYVDLLLREGRSDEAAAVADRALAAVGQSAEVALLVAQTRASGDISDLDAVLKILDGQAADPEAARLATNLREARARGAFDDPRGLANLADQAPNSLPIQLLVIRRLQELGAHKPAGDIAMRAIGVFPRQSEPARLAAISFVAQGNHAELLRAAEAWRTRAFPRPVEADLAVAQALVGLGQNDRALEELRPHLAAAVANPSSGLSPGLINIAARAMIASGREADCRALLLPLLASSASIRTQVWLPLAASPGRNADAAMAWLAEVEPHIPAGDDERLLLANANLSLLSRYPDRAATILAHATDLVSDYLAAGGGSGGIAHEILGVIRHQTGDLAKAEAAYREAIRLDDSRADAMNNLAYMLLDRGTDPASIDEAVSLAQRAIATAEPPSAAHLDTLGVALGKRGERQAAAGDAGAAQSFEASAGAFRRAIDLGGADAMLLARYAFACERAEAWDEAIAAYERILLLPGIDSDSLASLQNNLAFALVRPSREPKPAEIERARALIMASLLSGDRAAYWDTLGEVELAAARLDEAERAFRRAIELEPMSISARLGLGEALFRLGSGGAEQALRIAAELRAQLETDPAVDPRIRARLARFQELVEAPR